MIRFVLFVGVPIAEMALLIAAGDLIGLWWTLAVVIFTGILGAALVKRQGLAVWRSARRRLAEGSIPTDEFAHGAMLLVAGAFLLTPGFLTDITGFALLASPVREWLRRRFGARLLSRYSVTTVTTTGRTTASNRVDPPTDPPTRVEVWR